MKNCLVLKVFLFHIHEDFDDYGVICRDLFDKETF
jgi:hypothetical protein